MKLSYLVWRRHWRAGKFFNSPLTEEWRAVGHFQGKDMEEVHEKAVKATGARWADIQVTGISTQIPE